MPGSNKDIILAVELRDPDVLEFIIDCCDLKDPRIEKRQLIDVLCIAVKTENFAVIRTCLEIAPLELFQGYFPSVQISRTIFETDSIQILELFFQYGANPAVFPDLRMSVRLGNYKFIEAILSAYQERYKVYMRGYGVSALKEAICCGDVPLVSLFLSFGVDYLRIERSPYLLSSKYNNYRKESPLGTAIRHQKSPDQSILAMIASNNPKLG